jgi:hypothetical protein
MSKSNINKELLKADVAAQSKKDRSVKESAKYRIDPNEK